MRTVKNYKVRIIISKIQSLVKGKISLQTERKSLFDNVNTELKVNELITYGFTELGIISNNNLTERIISYSKGLKLYDPFNRKGGSFDIEEIKEKSNVAMFFREDLVKSYDILELANDPAILNIVQEFLGVKPTISNINMWWSFSNRLKAENAQLFHRDLDDFRFCKLFIYLTDVGENDGPHTFVKGSTISNQLTKIRRYEDEEIEDVFGKENIIHFIRPKFSAFLVNTFGFHKGTLPIDNDRLLLQIQYSINPIGIEKYNPIKVDHNYNKYINRLITK